MSNSTIAWLAEKKEMEETIHRLTREKFHQNEAFKVKRTFYKRTISQMNTVAYTLKTQMNDLTKNYQMNTAYVSQLKTEVLNGQKTILNLKGQLYEKTNENEKWVEEKEEQQRQKRQKIEPIEQEISELTTRRSILLDEVKELNNDFTFLQDRLPNMTRAINHKSNSNKRLNHLIEKAIQLTSVIPDKYKQQAQACINLEQK